MTDGFPAAANPNITVVRHVHGDVLFNVFVDNTTSSLSSHILQPATIFSPQRTPPVCRRPPPGWHAPPPRFFSVPAGHQSPEVHLPTSDLWPVASSTPPAGSSSRPTQDADSEPIHVRHLLAASST